MKNFIILVNIIALGSITSLGAAENPPVPPRKLSLSFRHPIRPNDFLDRQCEISREIHSACFEEVFNKCIDEDVEVEMSPICKDLDRSFLNQVATHAKIIQEIQTYAYRKKTAPTNIAPIYREIFINTFKPHFDNMKHKIAGDIIDFYYEDHRDSESDLTEYLSSPENDPQIVDAPMIVIPYEENEEEFYQQPIPSPQADENSPSMGFIEGQHFPYLTSNTEAENPSKRHCPAEIVEPITLPSTTSDEEDN